jgi:hypothetical protein
MIETLVPAAAGLAATALLCLTGLRAWRDWLQLRREELGRAGPSADPHGEVALRIELAAVKERLKRLEAIANGVEL